MTPNLLILGGTTEAMQLAQAVANAGFAATVSLAGRVKKPARQPLPYRIGGFGGTQGLATYLRQHRITHLIDATHPFAAQMSTNAIAACAAADVPMCALTRPAWTKQDGDRWLHVPSLPDAAKALTGVRQRVFLAVGRMHLAEFASNPQHFYLLRLVDPPTAALPLTDTQVVIARGPYCQTDDMRLLRKHKIDLVISKNAGGTGAYAKIQAARALGIQVLMIDRPHIPARRVLATPEDVLQWIGHYGTDLGV